MKKRIARVLGVLAAVALLATLIPSTITNGVGQPQGRPVVASALGIAKINGQDVLVDVVVAGPAGGDATAAAHRALRRQGAVPLGSAELGSDGFTLTGLEWGTLPVVQNYNAAGEPASLGGGGRTDLTNTHATWNGVSTSNFAFSDGGTTTRCPSLVDECPGGQVFDQLNDVGWLDLGDPDAQGFFTLGVTWSGESRFTGPEADMALTTNAAASWANDGETDFDSETVFAHENGHVIGVGHSLDTTAVMAPFYSGVHRGLAPDDEEAATYLYDANVTGVVSGTITDQNGPINKAMVVLEGTGFSVRTDKDGTYTISGVPDPVTYTLTATKGPASQSIDRLLVDGSTTGDVAIGGGVSTGSVSGTVTDADTAVAIEGAAVSVDTGQNANTDSNGDYTINDVPIGERTVTAEATGYQSQDSPATVNEGETATVDFALQPSLGGGGVTVTDIVPPNIAAGDTIGVTITGSGFVAGADVTFESGKGPSPTATVTGVTSTQITATVTVKANGPSGSNAFDVRVTNQDSSTGVLEDGFTVIR